MADLQSHAGATLNDGESQRAATGTHHVFVLAGKEAGPPDPAAILKKQGSTTHFVVFYDDGLGANGPTVAQAVLSTAEADFTALQGWFGGITPSNLPFVINIVPGQGGASHANCAATTLNCDAFDGTNSDLVRMLVVAEADEVFMAAQNKGWDCGASNGEGLSRVLATERYPAQLDGFATASSWLDSNRPDFVSSTDPTDRSFVSTGCATLFINYLRFQLGHSLESIVQAGGTTLQATYNTLTGSSNAFAPFKALLDAHFPPGTPVNLANDNPFPLGSKGDWPFAWGDVQAQIRAHGHPDVGTTKLVATATNQAGDLHVLVLDEHDGLWHTIRTANGDWPFAWGDVQAQIRAHGHPDVGTTKLVATATNQAGDLHVLVLDEHDGLWHTIRAA
jgi:hypothetical protein